jgi:hypothetical protein
MARGDAHIRDLEVMMNLFVELYSFEQHFLAGTTISTWQGCEKQPKQKSTHQEMMRFCVARTKTVHSVIGELRILA